MPLLSPGHPESAPSVTPAAPGSPVAADLAVDDLKDLMQRVTETSRQLETTHVKLQKEVTRLKAELAQANAQLRRSSSLAALGGMAAGIAHEIRNPLGSIQLYVQMLAEDVADHPDQVDLCGKIDRAVSGLDGIVRDVLLFAREIKMNVQPAGTRQLFDLALERCAGLTCDADVDLVRGDTEDFELNADTMLLALALSNIVRNAVEAMNEHAAAEPDAPRILRLTAERRVERCPDQTRAEHLVLGVEDSGAGISEDVIERMFNPFFTTRATGTGLGLAIVHRIVDAHEGHINVLRLTPRGTRFELCLKADGPATDSCLLEVLATPAPYEPLTMETVS